MTNDKPEKFKMSPRKRVFSCSVFAVNESQARTQDEQHNLAVYTLTCANWVNVVPITADGHVLLIEQHRFGVDDFTLEVPGGAIEKEEKDITMAALRELEEETGFTSKRLLSMPLFFPNPALQENTSSIFVALDVQPCAKKSTFFDPFEKIKLHAVPFSEAIAMVRTGRIKHSLSALALLLAEPYGKNFR